MRGRASRKGAFAAGLLLAAASIVMITPAGAESLNDALATAYSGNPTIRAARAGQRATDEQVPQAISGWRPSVTLQAELGFEHINNNGFPATFFNPAPNKPINRYPGSAVIQLDQPVFSGFRTIESKRTAQANVQAGRQNLLAVEQQILFDAVRAYMDVIRDRQVVSYRQKNVEVLQQQLKAAQERFNVGEITRTDVEQARASLAQSQANLAAARANLASSIATYTQVMGHAPGTLKYPKIARLPRSVDEAVATASEINPNILAAAFVAEAAEHSVKVARADLLPQIALQATATRSTTDITKSPNTIDYQVNGILTVPLYEAGRVYSNVRQAKQVASQRRIEIIETDRSVREAVASSWAFYIAAGQTITAARAAVSANTLALEGVRQEYLVGSRTTLDVLDAEAALVNSQVILVSAERDRVVAAYQLLASVGRLTAPYLALNVQYYDPVENYKQVKHKWIGTGVETVD